MTRLSSLLVGLGLLGSCSGPQHVSLGTPVPSQLQDTCEVLRSILTTPVDCNAEGCFPALREIDCIQALDGREGIGMPVTVVVLDPETGTGLPALREGEHCGGLLTSHRGIKDGVEEFVTIELKPKSQTIVEFHAALTIVTKADGRVMGHGGTACSGVRSGEVRREGSSWTTYTR
jgi:hypothetical protein